jgi:uncharacterized OB-fold protein
MTLPIIDVPEKLAYPPRITAFTRPFWDALSEGELRGTRCPSCGHRTFPPKPICPHCWNDQVAWTDVTPLGNLYSWTRVHAAPSAFRAEVPYCVGIVDLHSGLRIALRLVNLPTGDYTIDAEMELIVLRHLDGPLLGARPAV